MSIITTSYFDTPLISIPTGNSDNRAQYITYYEPQVIYKIFGYELGKLIIAYDVDASSQRIKDIVEGKEYELNGDTVRWIGFKNDEFISLIAFYVYYWWQRKNSTKTTDNGEIIIVNENSSKVSPALKIQEAWGYYMEQVLSLNVFMLENSSTYPEFNMTDTSESVNAFDL